MSYDHTEYMAWQTAQSSTAYLKITGTYVQYNVPFVRIYKPSYVSGVNDLNLLVWHFHPSSGIRETEWY